MREPVWMPYLKDEERIRLEGTRMGRRAGFGRRPALILVDVQQYMVGPPPGSPHAYPSGCGPAAEAALEPIGRVLAAARDAGVPVVYTRNVYRRDGSDMGVYGLKRDLLATEGWCLAGSEGAAVVGSVAPRAGEPVIDKNRPSAFFGTGLAERLRGESVDTVVLVGGATSNCVRATAVEAASHDFRVVVVGDAVFDRFEVAHAVALFDLDRQHADVLDADVVIDHLRTRPEGRERAPVRA